MVDARWTLRLALAIAAGCLLAGAGRAEVGPARSSQVDAVEGSRGSDAGMHDDLDFEQDYAEDVAAGDPMEPLNRGIFRVNEGLAHYAIEPVSKGWDYVMPGFVQHALRHAFDNLRFPIVFVNDLFQLKMKDAGIDLGRFIVNSTVGIAGLMDPASTIGLRRNVEDFGQTLAFWGVPPGPYLVLPFFGPSNIRDGFGLLVDTGLRAISFFIPLAASFAMQGVDTLNRRSLIHDRLEAERDASLDWYVAVRNAYTQYRYNLEHDLKKARTDYDYFPGLEIDVDRPMQE